jgi:hypothetical protein
VSIYRLVAKDSIEGRLQRLEEDDAKGPRYWVMART